MLHKARSTPMVLLTWLMMATGLPAALFLLSSCRTAPMSPATGGYPSHWESGSDISPAMCRYPFYPGELLAYRLFVSGLSAGTAWMKVNPGVTPDGSDMVFEGELRGGGFLDFFHPIRVQAGSTVESADLYPYAYNQTNLSGNRHVILSLGFDRDKSDRVQVQREESSKSKGRVLKTIKGSVDPLSGIFMARAMVAGTLNHEPTQAMLSDLSGINWDSSQTDDKNSSTPLLLSLFDGRKTRVVIITPQGTETLETMAGKFNTVKYDCKALTMDMSVPPGEVSAKDKPMDFTVWLTDDDRFIPVKAKGPTSMGDAEVELEKMVVNDNRERCAPVIIQ